MERFENLLDFINELNENGRWDLAVGKAFFPPQR